ncbi:MAG: hypothetical protein ACODAB_10355 [Gemmatimonadota bacterium]
MRLRRRPNARHGEEFAADRVVAGIGSRAHAGWLEAPGNEVDDGVFAAAYAATSVPSATTP